MEQYTSILLQDLYISGKISCRTFNALSGVNIHTVEELYQYVSSGKQLLSIRNLGRKSCSEALEILETYNPAIAPSSDAYLLLNETEKESFDQAVRITGKGDANLQKYIDSKYVSNSKLYYTLVYDYESIVSGQSQLSMENNVAFRDYHSALIDNFLRNCKNECRDVKRLSTARDFIKQERLKFNDADMVHCFFSDSKKDLLQKKYDRLCHEKLSVRAMNFRNARLQSFEVMVGLFDKPLTSYKELCPGQNLKKTLNEIFQLNQLFQKIFNDVVGMTDAEIEEHENKVNYPYLSYRQRQFVSEFIKTNGNEPLFYLAYNYLRISDVRVDKIYSLYYGIFDESPRSLEDLSEMYSCSYERIRQLLVSKVPAKQVILKESTELTQYEDLLKLSFIFENSPQLRSIMDREHLNCSFNVISGIVKLFSEYSIFTLRGDCKVLVRNDIKDSYDLKGVMLAIDSLLGGKYPKDTVVDAIVALKGIPKEMHGEFMPLIRYASKQLYDIDINEKGQATILQNCIDIESELVQILDEATKPMHVDDIFDEFKRRYPNHKYTNSSKLRPYLCRSELIGAVGKTSMYALTTWDDVYFGSIRDLLFDLLNNSDKPVHIDSLIDSVLEVYPKTNKKSIQWTMQDESLNRFVAFENGYYGLSEKEYDNSFKILQGSRRIPFEERIENFRTFVDTYHRFPNYSGGDAEASLQRWYGNVINGVIVLPEEQKALFDEMIKSYDGTGYPRTQTENEFMHNCLEYKRFIHRNHSLPSSSNGDQLYFWFLRTKAKYNAFSDQRYSYFSNLIEYITSLGFIVDN